MRIGLVQELWSYGDVEANLDRIDRFAAEAAAAGCDVVVFPELCDTGYALTTMPILAGTWPGAALDAVRSVAQRHGIGIIAGLSERADDGLYNAAAVFNHDGGLCGRYRKTHLFRGTEGAEGDVFLAGDQLVTVNMGGICWGLAICFDLRFPEVFRQLALAGAQVLVVLSAWPAVRIDDWMTLCRARAIENQLFLAGVNQTGAAGGLLFGGHSCLIGPAGDVRVDGGAGGCRLLIGDLCLEDIERTRRLLPVLSSRRPALYAPA